MSNHILPLTVTASIATLTGLTHYPDGGNASVVIAGAVFCMGVALYGAVDEITKRIDSLQARLPPPPEPPANQADVATGEPHVPKARTNVTQLFAPKS